MKADIYWVWLMGLKEIGNQKRLLLWRHFKTAEAIFRAEREALATLKGMREKDCNSIIENQNLHKAERAVSFMEKHGITLITIEDDAYPEMLKNIYNPPIALFCKGNIGLLKRDLHIGIVGSRKASPSGKKQAARFSEALAAAGITIVSGMAEGIDGESHRGALHQIGSTIAVIGTGINVCYPQKHEGLYKEIVKDGLIVTEYFMNEQPLPYHFPQRNRIISGLSDGLLVVEAREKSGALITAGHALEQGKNVYAIPRDIGEYQSVGCNTLIKDGAKVVTDIKDILEDYVAVLPEAFSEKASEKMRADLCIEEACQRKIYEHIKSGNDTVEMLRLLTGLAAGELNSVLSLMELDDLIKIEHSKIYLL